MQVFPVLLIAIVLAAEGGLTDAAAHAPWGDGVAAAGALLPPLLIVLFAVVAMRALLPPAGAAIPAATLRRVDRLLALSRWGLLVAHAVSVLVLGWLAAVRSVVGDPILLDEMIAITPPAAGLVGTWWAQYPLERRLREALDVRRFERGLPMYGIPRRVRYLWQQTRVSLLLILVPGAAIIAGAEMALRVVPRLGLPVWLDDAAVFAVGLAVFLAMPLIVRLVLDLEPIDDGPLADGLRAICDRHRVRVRRILRWRTDGLIMNAAVMGLVGRLRYVLLSDALLEVLDREELHAVMAHEIGHIRRAHLPWLIVSLMAVLVATVAAVTWVAWLALPMTESVDAAVAGWVDVGAGVAIAAAVFMSFGWLSRRYERQADTFAVQHLSAPPDDAAIPRVTEEAVGAMNRALGTIARLNAVDRHRKSWRHGSIAWRQAYLTRLIGAPVDRLPIDRAMRRLRVVTVAVLVAGGIALWCVPVDGAPAVNRPSPAGVAGR